MKQKLIQINTVCNTSTGRIMLDIQRKAEEAGYVTLSCIGRRKVYQHLPCKKYGNFFSFWIHVGINTMFDRQGYGSYFTTKRLIKCLKNEKPDIIHLHNLHGYYLHLPLLFHYLVDEFNGKIFWTFHDCWPFTGHCAYFTAVGCDKWKEGCTHCPNKMQYPISLFADASSSNYHAKREMFTQLKRLTIIVPSEWMEALARQSFMKKYPIEVVNNGIDMETFCYSPDKKVIQKYHLVDEKKIILGVASVWDKRKGLDDFVALSYKLPEKYQIVLVGLTRAQIRKLPSTIIGITRTENTKELVALYSQAKIFINPSREESFSLVTVEAMACGTPVIVLNTSAVKELVNSKSGVVVENCSSENYLSAIDEIEQKRPTREMVRKTAQKYNNEQMLKKIMDLYKE